MSFAWVLAAQSMVIWLATTDFCCYPVASIAEVAHKMTNLDVCKVFIFIV